MTALELANKVLEFLKNGKKLPTLFAWGGALLVNGDDYDKEYLQLYGQGGEWAPNGSHRALIVRHARYIEACVEAAPTLAKRVAELEEENERLRSDLSSRPSRERMRQMRMLSKRRWEERLLLEKIIQKGIDEITPAHEYMTSYPCEKNCDPEVGYHQPECAITGILSEWLCEANKVLRNKG